ncbi:MAG: hypothetical protein RJB13_790 [Pseudomonadota bacterium]|jgi:SAM-dependent methyltransferase
MTQLTFDQKAQLHWTSDRIKKVTGGKKLIIDPLQCAQLLRSLGLLNSDASMSADSVRKYRQINHMVTALSKTMLELSQQVQTVRILDCGCGNSYLTILIAWCFKYIWKKPAIIVGIDSRNDVIATSAKRAGELNLSDVVSFEKLSVQEFQNRRASIGDIEQRRQSRNHMIIALHACDTATDDAIALGFSEKSDVIAVAPCCQAELSTKWRQMAAENFRSAFSILINSPELRRDSCSTFTDAMRVLLMRGQGYEVTTTEFVPSSHTPKNRLILGLRRGRYFEGALQEYLALQDALGAGICLEDALTDEARDIMTSLRAHS